MKNKFMKYCIKCFIPSTKPNAKFDKNGICFACQNYKEIINLTKKNLHKNTQFEKLFREIKKQKKMFDVVIPVSGGKDSLYQVYKTKQYTDKILAVCIDFGLRNEIGEHNLNIIQSKLNVCVMKFTINHNQIKKLALYSLEKFGDPDLFNHIAIYNIPILIAQKFDVPLVLFGENSKVMYGSEKKYKNNQKIVKQVYDFSYFKNYVSHSGINLDKVLNKLKIDYPEKYFFKYNKKFPRKKILFFSSFFGWDEEKHYKLSLKLGFKHKSSYEGTYRNYINVDEDWNRVHHYLKLLKYGYGRTTDHVCEDIRLGKITRLDGKKLIKKYEFNEIGDYYIKTMAKFLKIKSSRLKKIIEKFRNEKLWINKKNKWILKDSEIFD